MVTGRADSASDSNRSARSARTRTALAGDSDDRHKVDARALCQWSGDKSWQRTRRAGTKAMRNRLRPAHRGGAKRRCRRAAAAGRWHPTCVPQGDGHGGPGAPRVRCGEKCTGNLKTACCFSARKRLLGRVSRPIYWAALEPTVYRDNQSQRSVTEYS
jgi:hypothetical protein